MQFVYIYTPRHKLIQDIIYMEQKLVRKLKLFAF